MIVIIDTFLCLYIFYVMLLIVLVSQFQRYPENSLIQTAT